MDGGVLSVEKIGMNRWRVETDRGAWVFLSYQVTSDRPTVAANWFGTDMIVLNGGATFLTLADSERHPVTLRVNVPAGWRAMTALSTVPGGMSNQYRADGYDELVDSPILAGVLTIHGFDAAGSRHDLVDVGAPPAWDGARAARDLAKIVREERRFWGALPFNRYLFLETFSPGGNALAHANSVLLAADTAATTQIGYAAWLLSASREYFHAFNGSRLRPAALGPFDYDHPPSTTGLWVSEGLTTYYGDLMVDRSGLGSAQEFLGELSGLIAYVQNTPGRLVETLAQASYYVWNKTPSGMSRAAGAETISYDAKGAVVGFLLDAKIRRATNEAKSLDDVMRLAYGRYGATRKFTAGQFVNTAQEVAGVDLRDWFRRAVDSTEELDYVDTLDWYGLRFAPTEDPGKRWTLEMRRDATDQQLRHLRALLVPAGSP